MTGKKKKLIFVITKGDVFGGAQKYVFDLSTSIDKAYFDTFVITGTAGLLNIKLNEKNIRTEEISYLNRDFSLFKDIRSVFTLISIFKKEKPDIIHLNSSKVGLFGAIAGRISSVPNIIFTSHGWSFNEDRAVITKTLFWLMHGLTAFLCHKIIAVSEAVKKDATFPFVKEKISVIYNGVSDINFLDKEEAQEIIEKHIDFKLSSEKTIIGSVAELHPVKGLRYSIEAIEECVKRGLPVQYVIIGGGEEMEKMKELITMKNLENKIFLTGFIPEAQTLLKAFDIFLLPSISESFGYVVAEAGLAELPVIATSVGGIPEVVDESTQKNLVPPKSSGAIATALEPFISNPLMRSQYGKTLKRHIENNFLVKNMIEKTVALYK